MILFFGVWLGWLPVAGYVPLEYGSGSRRALAGACRPSRSGLVQSALIARITRSSMLDVLREQYIVAGRAKGLDERAVVYKHALKNAHHPDPDRDRHHVRDLIVGRGGDRDRVQHPGPRRLIISAVLRRDYPVIQGVVLLHRRLVHADQPARGPGLPDRRPAGAVPVSAAATVSVIALPPGRRATERPVPQPGWLTLIAGAGSR